MSNRPVLLLTVFTALFQVISIAQVSPVSISLSPAGPQYICNTGKDTLYYSLSASNIPPNTNVVIYLGTDSLFNPYGAQGDSIGYVPGQSIPQDTLNFGTCVKIIGEFIDACGPSGQEGRNEYIVLTSGNGFQVNSLGIDFSSQNNSGNANHDININANPCSYKTPDPVLIANLRQGSCNASNVIPASPGDSIPPDVIVVVFTSDSVSANYSLNGLCNKGYPVYILQSACIRTIGAFTNAPRCDAPSRYRTTFAVDQTKNCSSAFTYDLCGIFDEDGTYAILQDGIDTASAANNGIRRNTIDSCGGIDYTQFSFSSDTTLKFPLQNQLVACNTRYYLKAVTHPNGQQPVSNTISFELVCVDVNAQARDNLICSGESADISISGSNQQATYSWTVNAGPNISGASGGNGTSISQVLTNTGNQTDSVIYTITALDNNCTASKAVTIKVEPIPEPTIDGSLSICAGPTTLTVVGQFDSVRWNTGANTSSIQASQAGTYTVTAYKNGCSGSESVQVSGGQVSVTITGNTTICNNGQVTLTAQGQFDSLRWNTNATTSSIQVTQTGTYSVTVYSNGCSGTDEVEVTSGSVPVEITGELEICPDGRTVLTVNGEYDSVRWSTNETTYSIAVSTGGDYSVTAYSNGCSGSDQVTVTELSAPEPFSLGNDTLYCGEFSLVLTTGDPTTAWNTQVIGAQITVTEGGTYIATISNACGTSSDTITIYNGFLPQVDLGRDTGICDGELQLTAPAEFESYVWNTGAQTSSITVTEPGVYSVIVTGEDGCEGKDSIGITLNCDNELFIPNAFSPNNDQVNDVFYVRGNPRNMEILQMIVYNRWGEKVFEANDILPDDPTKGWDGTFKSKSAPKESYAYRVVVKYANGEETSYQGNITLLR